MREREEMEMEMELWEEWREEEGRSCRMEGNEGERGEVEA